jgi:hypothetical protein
MDSKNQDSLLYLPVQGNKLTVFGIAVAIILKDLIQNYQGEQIMM